MLINKVIYLKLTLYLRIKKDVTKDKKIMTRLKNTYFQIIFWLKSFFRNVQMVLIVLLTLPTTQSVSYLNFSKILVQSVITVKIQTETLLTQFHVLEALLAERQVYKGKKNAQIVQQDNIVLIRHRSQMYQIALRKF